MKVILSRKGFDSGYGGYPSPIMPNGDLISIPIPDTNTQITYNELSVNDDLKYIDLMKQLMGEKLKYEGNGVVSIDQVGCHLDPDIFHGAYNRIDGWHGLFGQAGSAQSHLANNSVSAGDIFLFFGWFREVEKVDDKYRYSKQDKTGKHLIYGYLEVGDIKRINILNPEDWMEYHPHVSRGSNARDNDYIYIAKKKASFNKRLSGFGRLKYSDDVILTKKGFSRSRWELPDFFRDTTISYHSTKSWKGEYFQSAAKGQEFVIDCTDEIEQWVKNLIESSVV